MEPGKNNSGTVRGRWSGNMDGTQWFTKYIALDPEWWMGRIIVLENGCDTSGWKLGRGLPIFHLTNGYDSLTIRARSPIEALAIIHADGWPPKRTGRYNWEQETEQ